MTNITPLEIANRCRRAGRYDTLDEMTDDLFGKTRYIIYRWQKNGGIPTEAIRQLMPLMEKAGIPLQDAIWAGAEQ